MFAYCKNNGSRAQQLGSTCFKNFWTSFRIIEGTDKWESDKWGSTVVTIGVYQMVEASEIQSRTETVATMLLGEYMGWDHMI